MSSLRETTRPAELGNVQNVAYSGSVCILVALAQLMSAEYSLLETAASLAFRHTTAKNLGSPEVYRNLEFRLLLCKLLEVRQAQFPASSEQGRGVGSANLVL
jgi:hypothetical protein